MRKRGVSIRYIEKELGIPRSTLSGWFSDIQLTKRQAELLKKNQVLALQDSRSKAIAWHNKQKELRLERAEHEAKQTIDLINIYDKSLFLLCVSMLYLGEGTKSNWRASIGSSDPLILKIFIKALQDIFGIGTEKIRCDLNLRCDQNSQKAKQYWAEMLALPQECFKSVSFDSRTLGSKTFQGYNGVCQVGCNSVAIQRKLIALSRLYCESVTNKSRD